MDVVERGSKCTPFAIRTRITTTRCRATKKKIVGGKTAKNSSFNFLSSLCMALSIDRNGFKRLVAGRQRNLNAFLGQLIPNPLELLVVRKRDWSGIAVALHFTRRVINIGVHWFGPLSAQRRPNPRPLREVLLEAVLAFVGFLPTGEYGGSGGHVFVAPLPTGVPIPSQPACL